MGLLIRWWLFLLLASVGGWCAKSFYRFDYEWSDQAQGWLKYHAVPTSWNKAMLRCHAEGAVLASPLTNQMKAAMISYVQRQKATNHEQGVTIFSGVHSIFSEGDYSSVEGVPLLRLAVTWEEGEPDNFNKSERCLSMTMAYNGTMADTRCDNVLPYVCYKKDAQLNTTECGTTDPAYVLDSRTGSCYKLHKTNLDWSQAYMTCIAEGGYLAIINDDKEAGVVKEIYNNNTAVLAKRRHIMVGFHDWGQRSFMTIHGEALEDNYNKWLGNNPDNSYGIQFCGSVFENGQLDDYFCDRPTAFLCEKDPDSLISKEDYY